MRPSEHLRSLNSANWSAATTHAYTDALADGSMPRDKMLAYLEQDYLFVEAFVRLLASMVAHAPSLQDALPGARFLGVISGEENTYFIRAIRELGGDPDQMATPAHVTQNFIDLMNEAATSGSYAKMLAVLTVAEWVYLDWAAPVLDRADALPFWLGEWITLHSGAGFESVVSYLRTQLDAAWQDLSAQERTEVEAVFARAVALERAFFDAAWSGAWFPEA